MFLPPGSLAHHIALVNRARAVLPRAGLAASRNEIWAKSLASIAGFLRNCWKDNCIRVPDNESCVAFASLRISLQTFYIS